MRTPRQILRDVFRPAAPPADETPADFFPQVFHTPRALRHLQLAGEKRGRVMCSLITRMPSGRVDAIATPYGNLKHDQVIRVTCPEAC